MSLALSLAALGALTGCLVSPPPDYEEDARIPPVIDVLGAKPNPLVVQARLAGDTDEFSVQFRSNDTRSDGEASPIIWELFRDFGDADKEDFVMAGTPEPSTFDEAREIRVPHTFNLAGCHQFTLFVTQLDNGWPPDVDRPEDVAVVSWWFLIKSDDVPNPALDCLTEGQQ
jgi:hypothetical protein